MYVASDHILAWLLVVAIVLLLGRYHERGTIFPKPRPARRVRS
jgi:hypothetical protein